MFADIKSLGKETLIYGFSTVAARLLNFLLLPFYTHYLTAGEYGIVAAVFSYIAFMNIVYQYGMDQAYMRYASTSGTAAGGENFSTPFWSLFLTSLFFSVLICLAAPFLSYVSGLGHSNSALVRYSAWILALDALSIIPFAELRLKHRAWLFAGIRISNILVNVGMNILLVGMAGLGIKGVFLSSLAASAVSLLLLFPVFASRLRLVFNWSLFTGMLRFGAPLVPAGLGAMVVQVIDRPILLKMTNEATVGIYQANYRLGIFMMLLVSMFDQAWRPFFLERANRPDSGLIFGRILTYWMASGIWIVLALSFFIPDLVRLRFFGTPVIHPAFWAGLGVVPVVLTAYLFYGAYINFMVSVILSKRTDLLAWVTFTGAAVNICCNLLMIPRWGMMGAAWATLLAYLSMAVVLWFMGRSVHPVPYEYGRLARIGLATAFVAGAAWPVRLAAGGTAAWTFARAGILGLFPVLLALTGFFNAGEKEFLRALFLRGKQLV